MTKFKNECRGEIEVARIEKNGWLIRKIYKLSENCIAPNIIETEEFLMNRSDEPHIIQKPACILIGLNMVFDGNKEDALIARGVLLQQEINWVTENKETKRK